MRELLKACYYALDKKPITDADLNFMEREMVRVVLKKARGTDLELLLKQSGLVE